MGTSLEESKRNYLQRLLLYTELKEILADNNYGIDDQTFHDKSAVNVSRLKSLNQCTTQKMKFSIKDFFSKCDQIRSYLWIWSHLLKKSLMENFIFCAVMFATQIFLNYFGIKSLFSVVNLRGAQ